MGVGPGVYNESVSVPSYVRLLGSGADMTTISAGMSGQPVTFDGVIKAEVRGFTLMGPSTVKSGVLVKDASNNIVVARNIVHGNGDGVRFEGNSSGTVAFNTITGNELAGVHGNGEGVNATVTNNLVVDNGVGLRQTLGSGQTATLTSDYNLFNGNGAPIEPADLSTGDTRFWYRRRSLQLVGPIALLRCRRPWMRRIRLRPCRQAAASGRTWATWSSAGAH